jgi:CxxC motif-containing protein (DUF1111 family)
MKRTAQVYAVQPRYFFYIAVMIAFTMCRKPEPFSADGYDDRLSGGSQTAFDATSQAYTHPFEGLNGYDLSIHDLGDAAFEEVFVTAPSYVNNGLGPAYNNVSCVSCHHNDGIGVPTTGGAESGLLLRISLPGEDEFGGPLPVPGYGTQLQDKAVFGKQAECKIDIQYSYEMISFPDGETVELRRPTYALLNLYTPIAGDFLLSPRLAPPVFGLGLLEAIDEETILALADENDGNTDGISGKPNYVWNPVAGMQQMGRFGWKANTASLLVQVAAAYNNDMGITNKVFLNETVHNQPQADELDDDAELKDSLLEATKFYVQTLQVPARRYTDDATVLLGQHIFREAQCAGCHIETINTGVNVAFPQVSNQRIHPYTDLLLHDMGDGLADGRPDYKASGKEWRTAPLWGIGLRQIVNYPAYYLHDGRARNLLEAILWHGGEAERSKKHVQQLSKADRDALIHFLESL